jgi:hypothetical protein
VHRKELHHDRHVSQGQVEIDDAHRAFAVVRKRRRQVGGDRRLSDPALGGEDGDQRSALRRCAELLGAGGRERVVQGVGTSDSLVERLEVALFDHLAHAGAECLGQDGRVDAAPDQDHPDRRLRHPHRVGEGDRCRDVDRGPDDDGVLVGMLVEVPVQVLQRRHDGAARADSRLQGLCSRLVDFNDDCHVPGLT